MPRPLSSQIADWVVPWRRREWPIDWAAELGRDAPLALEIGFGNGEFLEREAARRPDRNHVGIELSWTSATYLFRRLDRGATPNVRVLLANAELALQLLFAPGSLDEVFINHPCPWPKERHHGRRLVRPETLPLLASRMAPGAPVTIVTDHAAYAEWIAETLEGQTALRPVHGATEIPEPPGRETTKYQRKAMAAGVPIHYFPWRKASEPDGPVPALLSKDPLSAMPSLTLTARTAEAAPADLFAGFETTSQRLDQDGVLIVVKLIAAFRREDRASWLVHALVQEDRLQQELAIEVAPNRDGGLLLKLSSLGYAHATTGVKAAIWCLGAWLTQRHPELAIAHHTLGERVAAQGVG
ncbi:MAG: hypothetical protein AAF682_24880 [Planctomycetota bacterium]